MGGVSTNQSTPNENRPRKPIKTVFKWLLIAAMLVAGLGVVYIIVVFAMFAFYKPEPTTYSIALGDLDGDGDLDAFYANGQSEGPRPNTVLTNRGGGKFIDSGQRLGNEESSEVTLADLDGDGDRDAWVANIGYNTIFTNDGQGGFSTNQTPYDNRIGSALLAIALGDLDGDGDLDALGGGCCGASESSYPQDSILHLPYNLTWINQGGAQGRKQGAFRSGQPLESLGAEGAALGDLDGDGDLDAWVTNQDANQVWLNAGGRQGGQLGTLIDSGQRLGDGLYRQVFLARLDGDTDLDAAVVDYNRGLHLEIWLNDGQGKFTNRGQRISHRKAQAFALGDLNGDGRADVMAGWFEAGYAIWWNQGNGKFAP